MLITDQLQALYDTVFVERTCSDYEEYGDSKLIIPTSSKESEKRVYLGKVLAAGPGGVDEKTGERTEVTVKKGDEVLFGKFIPNMIQLDGRDVYILKAQQIYAKVGAQ